MQHFSEILFVNFFCLTRMLSEGNSNSKYSLKINL